MRFTTSRVAMRFHNSSCARRFRARAATTRRVPTMLVKPPTLAELLLL